ncbi:MAG: hypothetical protein ABI024_05940, partial [Vicinamibacterales bacterium]
IATSTTTNTLCVTRVIIKPLALLARQPDDLPSATIGIRNFDRFGANLYDYVTTIDDIAVFPIHRP